MQVESSAVIAEVQALLNAQRVGDAAARLSKGARDGDPLAQNELAHWAITGRIIPRDLAMARKWLGKAGAGGHVGGAMLHAYFMANGTGGGADWKQAVTELRAIGSKVPQAAMQVALLDKMQLDGSGFPAVKASAQTLHQEPDISICRGLLAQEEADYLASAGEPYLQPSTVFDEQTGGLVPHPVRRSDGAPFGVHLEDPVVTAINRRIAALSDTAFEQGEPLQLLRYGIGGEYKPHFDALPDRSNQRILTVIVYLNEEYEGGETSFPRIGLSIRGRKGDALMFRNCLPNGDADPKTLHAGLPVLKGQKRIATRWIRERRFTYPPPTPLLAAAP